MLASSLCLSRVLTIADEQLSNHYPLEQVPEPLGGFLFVDFSIL